MVSKVTDRGREMGYVQIEELTRELDRDNDQVNILREDVPSGASMRFEFVADAPVDFFIKNISNRQKLTKSFQMYWFYPFGTGDLLTQDHSAEAEVLDSASAREWTKDYLADELQDIYLIAKLPRTIDKAKVSIRVLSLNQ
jgi:hypothetical protein